jgi:hypothetical protein
MSATTPATGLSFTAAGGIRTLLPFRVAQAKTPDQRRWRLLDRVEELVPGAHPRDQTRSLHARARRRLAAPVGPRPRPHGRTAGRRQRRSVRDPGIGNDLARRSWRTRSAVLHGNGIPLPADTAEQAIEETLDQATEPSWRNRTAVDVGQAARGFQRWGSRSSMATAG